MAPDQVQHDHAELIDALTELYTLLDTLGALPPADADSDAESDPASLNDHINVFLPPHPAGSINVEAAAAAGFAPEVVSLMPALPFLADDHAYKHGSGCELMHSTYALSYLGKDLDEGDFEWRREILNDELIPPTALKLTKSDVYGVEWIYDVGTGEFWPADWERPTLILFYSGDPTNELLSRASHALGAFRTWPIRHK